MSNELSAEAFKDIFGRLESAKQHGGEKELWKASELQQLVSFDEQQTFFQLLKEAKAIAASQEQVVDRHFITEQGGDMPNTLLTRYACHLIVRNFDATQQQVAFAQNYFITRNRQLDVILQRMHDAQRVAAREDLAQSEIELSGALGEHGIAGQAYANVRTLGDKALFGGRNTKQMKQKLNMPERRPLADFLATPIIEAKREAADLTRDTIITYNLNDRLKIESAHSSSNSKVRTQLYRLGIRPEYTPAAPDVKKVQRRLDAEEGDILKNA